MTDMQGNRIVNVITLAEIIRGKICCRKCAFAEYHAYTNDFISFTDEYAENLRKEEGKQLFCSQLDRLEWEVEH